MASISLRPAPVPTGDPEFPNLPLGAARREAWAIALTVFIVLLLTASFWLEATR